MILIGYHLDAVRNTQSIIVLLHTTVIVEVNSRM